MEGGAFNAKSLVQLHENLILTLSSRDGGFGEHHNDTKDVLIYR